MVVFGIVLLVVAGGLLYSRRTSNLQASRLAGVNQRTVSDVETLVKGVADEIGAGSYSEPVELVGTIVCDEPLTSPLDGTPCVHYDLTVTRYYDEVATRTDEDGKPEQYTNSTSQQVLSDDADTEFLLDDGSGRILVMPKGAQLSSLKSSSHQLSPREARGGYVSCGSIRIPVPARRGGETTTSYAFSEQVLPVGERVTVIGEVRDREGRIALAHSKAQPLMIGERSRDEHLAGSVKAAAWKLKAAIACLVVGVGLVIAGLL